MLWLPRRARIEGSQTLVSINLRLTDLLGPVTRVKKKNKDLFDDGADLGLEAHLEEAVALVHHQELH